MSILAQTMGVLARDAGIAALITFFLAVTIDRMFRQQALADVARAALGYLLPDPLKPEMVWIFQQRAVCIAHRQIVTITRNGDDLVSLRVETHRTIQNVTNQKQDIEVGAAVDEWGFPDKPTRLILVAYRQQDGQWEPIQDKQEQRPEVVRVAPQKVPVPSLNAIDVEEIFEETKRSNDEYSQVFTYATVNPEVTVHIDKSLDYILFFAHRAQPEVTPNYEGGWYRLPGTLLPLQRINIRWWPKTDAT